MPAILEIRSLSCSLGGRPILHDITPDCGGRRDGGAAGPQRIGQDHAAENGQWAGARVRGRDPLRGARRRRMGPDPPAPAHGLRHSGRRAVPALDRGSQCRAGAAAGELGGRARCAERVELLLEMVGLPPAEFRGRLSAPAFRRTEAARGNRARAGAPTRRCCCSTSPSRALDPITRFDLQRQFLELRRSVRKAALFVTHDVREALMLGIAHRAAERWRARTARCTPRRVPRGAHARSPRLPGQPGRRLEADERAWPRRSLRSRCEHLELVLITIAIAAAVALPAAVLLARRRRHPPLGAGLRQPRADHPQPGAVRIPAAAVIGHRQAHRHRGALPLCAAAHSAQHADRHPGRGPGGARIGGGDGDDRRQILWQVELPLAVPSIVAGLRIATVTTIGTATIAAAIGGGGWASSSSAESPWWIRRTVLAGAIPGGAHGAAADEGLEWIERRLSPVT